jgi:hypothetical protein
MTIRHLSEDQIVMAAIDPRDLPPAAKRHFDACVDCQKACALLEQELGELGDAAKKMLPAVPACVAPEKTSPGRPWLSWSAAGLLASCALILAFVWLGTPPGNERPLILLPDTFDRRQAVSLLVINDQREVFTPFEEFVMGADEVALDDRWWEFVAPFGVEEESLT